MIWPWLHFWFKVRGGGESARIHFVGAQPVAQQPAPANQPTRAQHNSHKLHHCRPATAVFRRQPRRLDRRPHGYARRPIREHRFAVDGEAPEDDHLR